MNGASVHRQAAITLNFASVNGVVDDLQPRDMLHIVKQPINEYIHLVTRHARIDEHTAHRLSVLLGHIYEQRAEVARIVSTAQHDIVDLGRDLVEVAVGLEVTRDRPRDGPDSPMLHQISDAPEETVGAWGVLMQIGAVLHEDLARPFPRQEQTARTQDARDLNQKLRVVLDLFAPVRDG